MSLYIPTHYNNLIITCDLYSQLIERSERTTVLFNSLLDELEDLLEELEAEEDDLCGCGCDDSSITQSSRVCILPSEEFTVESGNPSEVLVPNSRAQKLWRRVFLVIRIIRILLSLSKSTRKPPTPTEEDTTARPHMLPCPLQCSEAREEPPTEESVNPSKSLAGILTSRAQKRWRQMFLVIRIVRALLSPSKLKQNPSTPTKEKAPARPPVLLSPPQCTKAKQKWSRRAEVNPPTKLSLLPCPPQCIKVEPEAREVKSTSIMLFSQGPQIHMISQELRERLEAHVRRKQTYRLFGSPPKIARVLAYTAASIVVPKAPHKRWEADASQFREKCPQRCC